MSIRQDLPSPLTVRRWAPEEVLRALQQNGVGDAVPSFRRRHIDGNAFLRLSELQLTTDWNHELSLTTIRKITKLIDDIKKPQEKRPHLLNRPTKGFDLRIHVKPEDSPKPKLKPAPPPSHWKKQTRNAGMGAVAIPPVFGNRRDAAPFPPARDTIPISTAQGIKRESVPIPSALGNRRDPSPIPTPSTAGKMRGTSPVAASSALGVPSGLAPTPIPPPMFQNTGRPPPPIPPSKPQAGKSIVKCPSPVENESTLFGKELAKTLLMRAGNLAGQQNGWSIPKNVEAADHPTPKPPVALRPPALAPMKNLPVPPCMATGQEDEHMKEIVSSIQIPSVPSKVSEIIGNNERMDEEIYEDPDMEALAAEQADVLSHGEEALSGVNSQDIYEYIPEVMNSVEYYIQPTASVNTRPMTEFESTHVQVEELPVAPSIPAKPQGGQSSFISNFKSSIFRLGETKSSETQASRESNLLTKKDKLEEEPKKSFIFRSISPSKEKLTASSELRKSPSSSTTSLVTPNKGNTGQAASLPDQRLPPNLRPLPPTPGTSSFRSGPCNNTATVSRKICNPKTGITQQPWYHNVDRRRGEEIVCNREDGTFLIRPSTQNPHTLTIWFGRRVYNIAIRFRPDQKFALGTEKPNEQSFWSLEDMVTYYQTEKLVLYSGGERTGETNLKSSP